MNALKRNFVLSNKQKNSNQMALFTLEKLQNGVIGTLKTYHIPHETVTLSVSQNNQTVLQETLQVPNGSASVKVPQLQDLNGKFACVVTVAEQNNIVPLVWDTESENGYKYQVCNQLTNALHTHQLKKQPAQKDKLDLDDLFELQDGKELEKLIDTTLQQNVNANEFQKAEQNNLFASDTNKLKEKLKEGDIFYDLVSEQIQDLFNKFPSENKLEQLIPNSKWVKVDYENNGNPYVLGLIYDDITLKYICYGVPGEFEQNAPKELENFSQWLPLNPDDVSEGGYWVMYQDAVNGENIQIEFI